MNNKTFLEKLKEMRQRAELAECITIPGEMLREILDWVLRDFAERNKTISIKIAKDIAAASLSRASTSVAGRRT